MRNLPGPEALQQRHSKLYGLKEQPLHRSNSGKTTVSTRILNSLNESDLLLPTMPSHPARSGRQHVRKQLLALSFVRHWKALALDLVNALRPENIAWPYNDLVEGRMSYQLDGDAESSIKSANRRCVCCVHRSLCLITFRNCRNYPHRECIGCRAYECSTYVFAHSPID